MTTFIMTVLGVTVGILLTSVVSVLVMMHPRVWGWYSNKVLRMMDKTFEDFDRVIDKAFEEAKAKDL